MQNRNELEELVNSVTKSEGTSNTTDAELAELLEASTKKETPEPPQSPEPLPSAEAPQPQESPQPSAEDSHKQKMAKIREALAMANAQQEEPEAPPVSKPSQHEALPPLKRFVNQPAPGGGAVALPTQSVPPLKKAKLPKNEETEVPPAAKNKQSKEKLSSISAKVKSAGKSAPKKKSAVAAGKLPASVYALGIGGAVIVAALAGYFIVANTYEGKFLPNTMIDNLNLSGMTDDEAKYSLLQQKPLPDFKLTTPKGETAVFSPEDFDVRYDIPDGSFNEAAAENPFAWVGKLFKPSEYQIKYNLTYSEWKLRDLINAYDWGDAVSENAMVVRDGTGNFVIQPETLGDQFDTQTLLNYISEQTKLGRTSLNMEDSGCYESYRAEIKEGDLAKELDLYNNYAKCTITFDFDDRKKVIDSDMIVDWIMLDNNGAVMKNNEGQIIFDYAAISNFVAQMAEETDTYGKDRQFYSTMDGWITVPWSGYPYSIYGWQIDQEATINQIISLMREGQTVTVEPEYSQRGYVRATDDIGTTYIDVDISEQHMWVYKENQIVFEADFVSGTETNPGRRTPRGVCKVADKAQNVTLGTYAVQGYEQPVAYWIPFNHWGCGFHDLPRGAYGGQIYMYNGSHGCLNMSLSKVRELYDIVEVGMPVMVHD